MIPLDFQEILASPTRDYEEGPNFFRGQGMVNKTLKQLVADLDAHEIDYNVIGAVALNQHGYRRFIEAIDLLMMADGLTMFQAELIGRGYRPAFNGATKKFRETERDVPIEILVSGEYSGDGKPKSVIFPDPAASVTRIDGVKTIALPKLIELKLASDMTGAARLKGLADVQELIRARQLGVELAALLAASVREKHLELWTEVEQANREENQ